MARKKVKLFSCDLCDGVEFHREQDLKRHRTMFHSKTKIDEEEADKPSFPSAAELQAALQAKVKYTEDPFELAVLLLLFSSSVADVKAKLKQIL